MKKIAVYFLFFLTIIGCSGAKHGILKDTQRALNSNFFNNQFTGFLLVNSQNSDTLLNFNGEKYFTPASNTKIFTLFTSLHLLPDSIPALKYIHKNDTLFIEGTGDPTFLHTDFENNKTLNFLKEFNHIAFNLTNYNGDKLGPGWAWEDYQYGFQAEKGAFPLYGNVVTLHNSQKMYVLPAYFKDSVSVLNSNRNRELEENRFFFSSSRKDTLEIPFRTTNSLTQNLLENELQKKITLTEQMPAGDKKTFFSFPSDSVFKRMMHDSDNFLAEQLLIAASSSISDTLSSSAARDYILKNELVHLRQPPRWVDGSGLSRYNLFTPESMVYVLHKMYRTIPRERLFDFFPAGGSGTLKEWYPGDPKPYVFAKTGSVGNNHNISGYLITKSGKTLIFSFMNNHFTRPSSEIKKRMQLIFEEIRDTY